MDKSTLNIPDVNLQRDLEAVSAPLRLGPREIQVAKSVIFRKSVIEQFDSAMCHGLAKSSGDPLLLSAEPANTDILLMSTKNEAWEDAITQVDSTGTATWSMPYVRSGKLNVPLANATGAVDGITARELTNGIATGGKNVIEVGKGLSPYLFRAKFSMADVSDCERLLIGIRTAEAYKADPTAQTTGNKIIAALRVADDTGAKIAAVTRLAVASAVTATAGVAIADADEIELEIEVDQLGRCSIRKNGSDVLAVPLVIPAGEKLIPFVYIENDGIGAGVADSDPGLSLSVWELGRK